MFKSSYLMQSRYTWAEESLSTWNLQRMKPLLARGIRYPSPHATCIESPSRPKIWIQLPTACWVPWWAETQPTTLKGSLSTGRGEKNMESSAAVQDYAKMSKREVTNIKWPGSVIFQVRKSYQWPKDSLVNWDLEGPRLKHGMYTNIRKGILGGKRREWKKSSRLQGCKPGKLRTTDRHILQLEREPAGKDDRSGLEHPEFQAMAKQPKENVNQRQKSHMTEAVSGPPPIRGQTSNSSSNYICAKIN